MESHYRVIHMVQTPHEESARSEDTETTTEGSAYTFSVCACTCPPLSIHLVNPLPLHFFQLQPH